MLIQISDISGRRNARSQSGLLCYKTTSGFVTTTDCDYNATTATFSTKADIRKASFGIKEVLKEEVFL